MRFINHEISYESPVYIIAEMSANHGGDIDMAKKIIKAAKEAGANCIKTQTYTADTMTIDCDNDIFKIKNGLWKGYSLYDLYNDAHMPWEWQAILKDYADEQHIDFLSTPFDSSSVDYLESLDVQAYKISSFEIVDIPLIKYIASKQKPVVLSTGMATLSEIENAVNVIRSEGNNKIILLKCSSAYPASGDGMNLKTMKNMMETFGTYVGLSDHSMNSVGAISAVALGAKVIEKHLCLSRSYNTADSGFSMEPDEFAQMVNDIRQTERALGKIFYGPSEQEKDNIIFRRSIICIENIGKGELFTQKNIRVIRPGHGLSPKYYNDILGKRALFDINKGDGISFDMIGNE